MDAPPPPPQPATAGGYAARFSPSGFIHAPLAELLEYSSGVLRAQANGGGGAQRGEANAGGDGEVSIWIVGADHGEEGFRAPGEAVGGRPADEEAPAARGDEAAGGGGGRADPPYGGYDVQRAARWVEHALPFCLLLLGVFIRQHLQGFFVMIWIAAVMFKSNDILRKQTALKVCAPYLMYQSTCLPCFWRLDKCCVADHVGPGQQLPAEMRQYLLSICKIMLHSCSANLASNYKPFCYRQRQSYIRVRM